MLTTYCFKILCWWFEQSCNMFSLISIFKIRKCKIYNFLIIKLKSTNFQIFHFSLYIATDSLKLSDFIVFAFFCRLVATENDLLSHLVCQFDIFYRFAVQVQCHNLFSNNVILYASYFDRSLHIYYKSKKLFVKCLFTVQM